MDFIVLSHLRWNFVFQRPQHLFSRCACQHRVFFWEEPIYKDNIEPCVRSSTSREGVNVLTPELPTGLGEPACNTLQRELLDETLTEHNAREFVAWYYTPMAWNFSRHLRPMAVIYDCMDELSAFRGAPPGLRLAEAELFRAADLVFTGGASLYQSKRKAHHSVHLFPSSIDMAHFKRARSKSLSPADQETIQHPRMGYCGVIDERMDLSLISEVADLRPDWQLVMLGPIVKVENEDLPRRRNIHYLGPKNYDDLPDYMAGWEVGLLPFARNESTRFISPTKTPEYLAAGLPVVSTPITDVVRPYGELGLVSVAETAADFAAAIEKQMNRRMGEVEAARLRTADTFISRSSWDKTWAEMYRLTSGIVRRVIPARGKTGHLSSANTEASAIGD